MSFFAAARRSFRAADLVEPVQELESEGDGLRVHAVGAAHHDRVLVLDGTGCDRGFELAQVLLEDFGGLDHADRGRGVLDVVRGQAQVNPAPSSPRLSDTDLRNAVMSWCSSTS